MWIAKNSITGKTYGESFDSIYDCQSYIDNVLTFLQYEWKQIIKLEESFDSEIDYQKWYKKHYCKNSSFCTEAFARIQYAVDSIMETKTFSGAYGQNVIRCWHVEQNRFADGFDF